MNLTWHIVRKDCVRVGIPAVLWSLLLALTTLGFGLLHPPVGLNGAAGAYAWTELVWPYTGLTLGIEACLGVLLVASLIHEDRLTGSTAFWFTRPISGARLGLAKLSSSLLLFVALPVALQTVVWFAFHFTGAEIVAASAEFAFWQLALVVFAFGLAAITSTLATFLPAGIVFAGACLATSFGGFWRSAQALREVAVLLIGGIAVAALIAMAVGQFLKPRRRAGLAIYGLALAAMVAVRISNIAKNVNVVWAPGRSNLTTPASNATEAEISIDGVLWRMPLVAGAIASGGSNEARIIAVSVGENGVTIFLAARGPRLIGDYGPGIGGTRERARNRRHAECFLVQHPDGGFAIVPELSEVGSISLNSVMLSVRSLRFRAPVPETHVRTWLDGATVSNLRFPPGRECVREGGPAPIKPVMPPEIGNGQP